MSNNMNEPIPRDISNGNLLAAVASFFIPGLGQLVQGRLGASSVFFLLGIVVWVLTLGMLGWVVNILSAIEAAVYVPGPGNENVFMQAGTLMLVLAVIFTVITAAVVVMLGIGLIALL